MCLDFQSSPRFGICPTILAEMCVKSRSANTKLTMRNPLYKTEHKSPKRRNPANNEEA